MPVNLDKYHLIKGFKPEHKIDLNTQIRLTNSIIKNFELPTQIEIIDIHNDFLDINNQMSESYSYDGVHLNENGYKLWVNLLKEKVENINDTYLK